MDLIGRDFLTLLDFTPAEIGSLLDLAAELKAKKKAGIPHDTLRGKNVALIFEKTSTRTRCSFEVAAHHRRDGAQVHVLAVSQMLDGRPRQKRRVDIHMEKYPGHCAPPFPVIKGSP